MEEELVEKTKELEKYIQLVGPLDSNIESSMSAKLQQKEQELNNIKQKFDYYQKSEQRLISELEALGKAWSKLEEQNSKRVASLQEKEEQLEKLSLEVIIINVEIQTGAKSVANDKANHHSK